MNKGSILVIGGGTMGISTSVYFSFAGFDIDLLVREDAVTHIQEKLSYAKRFMKRQIHSNDMGPEGIIKVISNPLSNNNYHIIFESISEDFLKKTALISELSKITKPNSLWVTNTSSLSISDLSVHYKWPERFLGIHFFNPVTTTKLTEIIPSSTTSKPAINDALNFCKALHKIPILVKDRPGFIVNRLLIPLINNASQMVEDSIANTEDIDNAMKLGAGFAIGPLALSDLIGTDVVLNILLNLNKSLPQIIPSKLLIEMVNKNQLGRKTKLGFYKY